MIWVFRTRYEQRVVKLLICQVVAFYLQLDDGAGILRKLYPGLRQNIYVELAEAFKTYETLRRIRDVSAARGLPKNEFRIMMRRSEASPLDTMNEYGRVIKKRSEPR